MSQPKKIFLTGATDGIGLATAQLLASGGHHLLLHGRNTERLESLKRQLGEQFPSVKVELYRADLSNLSAVEAMAKNIIDQHPSLDVVINNAGVFKTQTPTTSIGIDVRFVVNTIAPYLLTQRLLPLLNSQSRVVNLSSAAQAEVNLKALAGASTSLDDFNAYAQSKLAITQWSVNLAKHLPTENRPLIVAVNPGSLLASKMVKEGFGIEGHDINIGADILKRAALSEEFAHANGLYFDNDSKAFAEPHNDALDENNNKAVVNAIKEVLAR